MKMIKPVEANGKAILFAILATPVFATFDFEETTPLQSPVINARVESDLNRGFSLIQNLRGQLNRANFEVDALVESLDYDPQQIIRFVQEEIGFQPYPGVLRGARGTLMSSAGNSVDQSLLLATLLKDAGFKARIVQGTLKSPQTKELLMQIKPVQVAKLSTYEAQAVLDAASSVTGSGPKSAELMQLLQQSLAGTHASDLGNLMQAVQRDADDILASLERAGISSSVKDFDSNLAMETTQYFWVEYKESAAEPWIAIHPSFKEIPDSFRELKADSYITDSIPDEYHQTISVSAVVVQQVGGKLIEHPIMSPWKRPVANLHGRSLTFSAIPVRMLGKAKMAEFQAMLDQADAFLPIFNDSIPEGAQVFDLRGRVVSPDVATSQFAGIIRTTSDQMADAATMLEDMSEPIPEGDDAQEETQIQSAMTLESLALRVTLSVPGRPDQSYEKVVFRRQSNANQSISRSVNSQITIGVGTGAYPENYMLDQALKRLQQIWPFLSFIALNHNIVDSQADIGLHQFKDIPSDWAGFPVLFQAFVDMPASESVLQYFDQPVLGFHSRRILDNGDIGVSLDIQSNLRKALQSGGAAPDKLMQFSVRSGVWDTHLEKAFVGGEIIFSTPNYMSDARRMGIELLAISADQAIQVDRLQIPESFKQQVKKDLSNGYHVVVPTKPVVTAADQFAWWRVNPETGNTLGMLHDGSGGALSIFPISGPLTEYLAKLIVTSLITGAFAYYDYRGCREGGGSERCCQERVNVQLTIGGAADMLVSLATSKGAILAAILVNAAVSLGYMAAPGELVDCWPGRER